MKRSLLIVGSAPNAKEDLCAFSHMGIQPVCSMAIGLDTARSGALWFPDYIATYHVKDIPEIKSLYPYAFIISHLDNPFVDFILPHSGPSGSSALLGVLAGIKMGYEKLVLCGCPLQGKNRAGRDYFKMFADGWKIRYNQVAPFVRSMSGWTRELLGEPTVDWMHA
jgi:hypothetical protein